MKVKLSLIACMLVASSQASASTTIETKGISNAALLAKITQISMEFAVSIDATRLEPTLFKSACKSFIVTLTLRLCAAPPRVVPTRMNIKQLT